MSTPDARRPPAGTEGRPDDHPTTAIETHRTPGGADVYRLAPVTDPTPPAAQTLRGIEISLDVIAERLSEGNAVLGELVDQIHRGRFDGSFSDPSPGVADQWAQAFDRNIERIERGLPQGPAGPNIVEIITLAEPLPAKDGAHVVAWGFAGDGEVYPYVVHPGHPVPLIAFGDVL